MEVVQITVVIYAALCLGFTLILTAKPPLITVHKTNYTVVSGTNVTLECIVNANGETITSIEWWYMVNQQWIRTRRSERYVWTIQMPSLVISNVQILDSRFYKCVASTDLDTVQGPDILLNVQNKPIVTVSEYNYSTGEGDNLTLHCSIDGHGSTVKRVGWLKERNSQLISLEPTTRVFWDISSPSMKINIVQLDDAGLYTCSGVTDFGTTTSSQISVQIFSKPSISIPVFEYLTRNGTTAVLQVRIDDGMQTSVSVQWEKYKENNQQWFPLENNSRLLWTYSEPCLRIATALVEDDGKYRIIAKTAYHEVRSSPIALTVYVPVKIKELETRPVFIREGDIVEIRCLVDGRPEPKVTWRLANGTTIIESSFKSEQGNILFLESATKLNEGNYTCIAENSFSADEYMICLTVSGLPLFNPPNEKLTGSPLEKYAVPAVSVFVCVTLIALIVVVILMRRKRQTGRTDKPNAEIRSKNGQKHPSPSENICSGNNYAMSSVHPLGDMTYPQMIRKSSKDIDGNNSNRDTDASKVYMNINNTSNSNSNSYINVEMETENTQMNKTGELNYEELNFSYNAQEENIYLGIQGPDLTQRVHK